uniref:Uncharacterized protein n=1 Tax=Arundo donax TaxID=35708 RepID=A0A0A9APD6_ARUDO
MTGNTEPQPPVATRRRERRTRPARRRTPPGPPRAGSSWYRCSQYRSRNRQVPCIAPRSDRRPCSSTAPPLRPAPCSRRRCRCGAMPSRHASAQRTSKEIRSTLQRLRLDRTEIAWNEITEN